eukprot:scaffold36639_cov32-Tisochrysis_lutea.AAC.4
MDHNVDAEAAALVDLSHRRDGRHDDRHRYSQLAPVPCKRQRMVAGGGCDDSELLLLWRQREKSVAPAALLEAARELELLRLEVDLASRREREPVAPLARRAHDAAPDPVVSANDILKSDAVPRGHGRPSGAEGTAEETAAPSATAQRGHL